MIVSPARKKILALLTNFQSLVNTGAIVNTANFGSVNIPRNAKTVGENL